MNNEQQLLQFPCEFMIKAVGNASDDFADLVLSLVKQHAPDTQDTQISLKESGKGNFLSATARNCTLTAFIPCLGKFATKLVWQFWIA